MQNSLLLWIPIISLLIYTPIVCYLDCKHRDIGTHKIWLPLLAVNMPVLFAGYLIGTYPIVMLMITAISATAWILLLHHRGGDAVWLACITLFVVVNPLSPESIFFETFLMYLIIFTAATFWYVWLDNRMRTKLPGLTTKNGIPFLITISCALIAAIFLG